MRRFLFAMIVLSLMHPGGFGQNHHTSLVSVSIPDRTSLEILGSMGFDLHEIKGKPGDKVQLPVSSTDLAKLSASGLQFTILQENMEQEYESTVRNIGPYNALGFGLGSMGGHYTLAELVRQLDSLKLLFPNLITTRQSLGTSHAGRPIWAVKISDNPDLQEDEPEVLYTALTHAREPAGMMTIVYFMWRLLQGYGTDPEVTYIVNNRQLWFVPCVNPDGYEYNRRFFPNGGGMRRKNIRNADTTVYNPSAYGVDLNRNFGTHAMWNSPHGGSSDNQLDDTYRGTIEWSEPEAAALRNFAYAHQIKAALNYHTFGDFLIYPWGYQPLETEDSLIFRDYAREMTSINGYHAGRSTETVGYSVRGVSDDFFYGDPAKPKVFSMTPEVGDRFWALPQDILPFAQENLYSNLYLARIAGGSPKVKSYAIADADSNSFLDRGETFSLNLIIENAGLDEAQGLVLECMALDPVIDILEGSENIGDLPGRAETSLSLGARVATNSPTGIPARMVIQLTESSGLVIRDTITVLIGHPVVLLSDSASTISNWTAQPPWGVSTTHYSPPQSFTDSPSGSYSSNTNVFIRYTNPINIPSGASTQLTFWTKWDIEDTWDFARVEISQNNGATWKSLPGRYTHLGSGIAPSQPDTAHGLDGTQPTWVQEQMDLSAYAGLSIRLRFRLTSDISVEEDGWYIDDINILGYVPNYDTGLVVVPSSVVLNGVTGTRLDQPVSFYNHTESAMNITLVESTATSFETAGRASPSLPLSFSTLLRKAKDDVRIHSPIHPVPSSVVFTTAVTDPRGDNLLGGTDVLELLYQTRGTIFGPVLDLRVKLDNPDSNVAGLISLDADQNFTTGIWPTPWGLGPRGRDLGAEFEVLVDATGFIADSLGLGNVPIAVVLRTADTSLVYFPIVPTITHDSVMTITVSGIPLGPLGLNDADQNINVGCVFARLDFDAPFPDFGPDISHGVIGNETGVPWMAESANSFSIPSGDSAVINLSVLAAKPTGTYQSYLRVEPSGQPVQVVPVTMNVTSPGAPEIHLGVTSLSDTLLQGDSVSVLLEISNSGSIDLVWRILDTAGTPWINVEPELGLVPTGSSNQATITLRSTDLSPGMHSATLLVVSNDPSSNAIEFPVVLLVDPNTSVDQGPGTLPTAFVLYQNYPNPFNPETVIGFDIPVELNVEMALFDILGKRVQEITKGPYPAGSHRVQFDGSRLPSGIYFYLLNAGVFVQQRKMVLIK